MQTSEHRWKTFSASQWDRTSNIWIPVLTLFKVSYFGWREEQNCFIKFSMPVLSWHVNASCMYIDKCYGHMVICFSQFPKADVVWFMPFMTRAAIGDAESLRQLGLPKGTALKWYMITGTTPNSHLRSRRTRHIPIIMRTHTIFFFWHRPQISAPSEIKHRGIE